MQGAITQHLQGGLERDMEYNCVCVVDGRHNAFVTCIGIEC